MDQVLLNNGKEGLILKYDKSSLTYLVGLNHAEGEIKVSKDEIKCVISTDNERKIRASEQFKKNWDAIVNG